MQHKLLLRLLLSIALLGVITGASAYSLRTYEAYDLTTYYVAARYTPGGETVARAKQQSGAYAALKGGYFNPASRPIANVDLTIVGGSAKVGPLPRNSPTLISVGQVTRVVSAEEARMLCHQVEGAYGLAGAAIPVYPRSRLARHFVVVHNNILYDIELRNASQADCERFMKGRGIASGKVVYLDGGSSLHPKARMPSHLLVKKKTLMASTEPESRSEVVLQPTVEAKPRMLERFPVTSVAAQLRELLHPRAQPTGVLRLPLVSRDQSEPAQERNTLHALFKLPNPSSVNALRLQIAR